MTTFRARRLRFVASAVLAGGLLAWLNWLYDLSLRDASFLSGWILVACLVFLTLFNVRKKLPVLPLISASLWLQLHIYVGLLTSFVFLMHTSWRLPQGPFEKVLWLIFVVLSLSGLFGLLLSRALPNLIRQRGERVLFERIPGFRAELAREAQGLAEWSVTESNSNAIASYFAGRLQTFFQGPRNFFAHLQGTVEPLNKLQAEMASLQRYMDPDERAILEEIEERVVLKDDLDRQYALQFVLKAWLFVHIPLTYMLLVLSLCHVVLVYAFSMGSL